MLNYTHWHYLVTTNELLECYFLYIGVVNVQRCCVICVASVIFKFVVVRKNAPEKQNVFQSQYNCIENRFVNIVD